MVQGKLDPLEGAEVSLQCGDSAERDLEPPPTGATFSHYLLNSVVYPYFVNCVRVTVNITAVTQFFLSVVIFFCESAGLDFRKEISRLKHLTATRVNFSDDACAQDTLPMLPEGIININLKL